MNTAGIAWSVLTKSVGPAQSPAPTDAQTAALLERLPGGDKWIQYPPASGRGHAFETRFWLPEAEAVDASDAASRGARLVADVQAAVGLGAWVIVRAHSASLDERAIEHYPGLESRAPDDVGWSVMVRAQLGDAAADPGTGSAERVAAALAGEDALVSLSGRLVELRFWVTAADAVDAARRADTEASRALAAAGWSDWTTVRIQTASVAERRREMYLGVERRLRERDGT